MKRISFGQSESSRSNLYEDPYEDAKMEAQMVDLEAVKRFIFPETLQHAMSTGRLFAFGLYGPLDADACLRSGHKGQHVVTRWELDTMCRQFEREDILQVYTLKGQSHSNLSEAQAEELLAQADSRLKVAKGKAMMRQITREEVDDLFASLERDTKGRLNFHKMQHAIMEYRQDCISRNKVVFPRITSMKKKKGLSETGAKASSKLMLSDQKLRARTKGLSADIAPRSMFLADAGMNNMDVASHTNRLLSTKAFTICNIADGNSSSLTANVRLIRAENEQSGRTKWDANCAKRGSHMGSFVKAEYSSTTAKRRS